MSKIKAQTAKYIQSLPQQEKDVAIAMLATSKRDAMTIRGWNLAFNVDGARLNEISQAIAGFEADSSIPVDYAASVAEILSLFQSLTGVRYKMPSKSAALIVARLNEYPPDALKAIIKHKFEDWKDTDFIRYVRPETLFRKSNCERYVAEIHTQLTKQNNATRISQIAGVVERAKRGV